MPGIVLYGIFFLFAPTDSVSKQKQSHRHKDKNRLGKQKILRPRYSNNHGYTCLPLPLISGELITGGPEEMS